MAIQSQSSGIAPPGPEPINRSLIARWNHEGLFDKGFVATPVRFLEFYAHLRPHPLSAGEALFVLELMSFKWSEAAPFPSYKRIAARMNISDKMCRRYAKSLETKGYLRRLLRMNNTNTFDLSGLFNALLGAIEREKREIERERREAADSTHSQGHTQVSAIKGIRI
jgi:hypothetical protein